MTRDEVLRSIEQKLQNDAGLLSPEEVQAAIDDALRRLTLDRPFTVVADIAGDDTADMALPSTFVKGFSTVESVEYPAGENPPIYLEKDDDWFVYEDPTKSASLQQRLRFKLTTAETGESVRINISGRYTFTDSSSNLDPAADMAVIAMALVYCYQGLASKFNQTGGPSIVADSVDFGAKAQNFLYLADKWRAEYKAVVGLEKDSIKPAQSLGEVDVVSGDGQDMVWHAARRR